MSDAIARHHHRPIRGVVVGALLLGAGCGSDGLDDGATPTTSSSPPTTSPAATEPLEDLLRWLVLPTGDCAPDFPLVETSDDPMVALLQALGLEPNTRLVCSPAQEGP